MFTSSPIVERVRLRPSAPVPKPVAHPAPIAPAPQAASPVTAARKWLVAEFPESIGAARWPFAIGVRQVLLAHLAASTDPHKPSRKGVHAVLRAIAHSRAYQRALKAPGARRTHLDGTDAGPVNPNPQETP